MEKEKLFGKTLTELSTLVVDEGLPKYTAKQLAGWLYNRGANEIAGMTDISICLTRSPELCWIIFCRTGFPSELITEQIYLPAGAFANRIVNSPPVTGLG